ncbi:MAG TPA: hypothetical protein IAD07_09500 [Candidatus Fimivicinus intestinavium]|nr:hypothetical protein [Candidatus Fimivicinus intestinavium]
MIQKGIRFFCVICLVFSAAFLTTDAIRASVADAGLSGNSQATAQAPYWLGIHQGKVASFQAGHAEPLEVFDIYLSSLPKVNQQELLRGIPAQNRRELQRLIEDYTS